jgi:polyisoprenoid-binding protein YceI
MMRTFLAVVASAALCACGGAAVAPSPSPTPSPSPSATTAGVGAALVFNIDPASKATVRVREQLVRIPAPSDAVLTATGVSGSFTLNPDGTFAPTSKITVDLTTLTSDQSNRDSTIKREPLEVTRFRDAVFVPTKATGLSLPLPASADMKFTLAGKMTIHGTTKEVTFAVVANRTGSKLTATATADPSWKFGDFGMSLPVSNSVLSVVDDIRLEFSLVANEAKS